MKRVVSGVSVMLLACCASSVFAQANWAERLGFPAGKRVVILHANDMGVAYEFNRPAETGLQDGIVTSASVISAGPWFGECVEWLTAHPGKDVGVTLSFVSPSTAMQWGPVAPRDEVPSLATADGYFPSTALQFTMRADAEQVRLEARAQIERARAAGLKPTHLHPHMGAILTRPDLLEVYLALAEEMWIPAVMVEMTPEVVEKFRSSGFDVPEEMVEVVANYRLPKLDDIRKLPPAQSYEEKRDGFFSVLKELPPGLTQVFLNPADDTPGLRRMTEKWQDRVWETQLLTDPAVRDFLTQQDIVLTNWRDIMKRFETANEDRKAEED